MLQRVEPGPFFLGDMFGDHVAELFNQRQLAVFRIKITEERKGCQLGFLRKSRENSADVVLQIRLKGSGEPQLSLHGELRLL